MNFYIPIALFENVQNLIQPYIFMVVKVTSVQFQLFKSDTEKFTFLYKEAVLLITNIQCRACGISIPSASKLFFVGTDEMEQFEKRMRQSESERSAVIIDLSGLPQPNSTTSRK